MKELLVNRFWLPPLLRAQSTLVRVLNLALPPLLWGVLCGLFSAVGRAVFTIGIALSLVGAFGAGRQHLGAGAGLLRGAFAGTIFGTSVLAGHAIVGSGSLMFHPAWLQVAFTAALGGTFAAWGGRSRLRREGARPDAALLEPAVGKVVAGGD